MTAPWEPTPEVQKFIDNLHATSAVVSYGVASVAGHDVPAVEVTNLYKQHIVWGPFSMERGKFKGKLANNANTDEVSYKALRGPAVKLVARGQLSCLIHYDPVY